MRELIGKGLLTAAAASSVFAMTGGYAQATDAAGTAAGSPGLLGQQRPGTRRDPGQRLRQHGGPGRCAQPRLRQQLRQRLGRPDVVRHPGVVARHAPARPGRGARRPAHRARTVPAPSRRRQRPPPRQQPPRQRPGPRREFDAPGAPRARRFRPRDGRAAPGRPGGPRRLVGVRRRHQLPGLLSGNLLQAPLDIPLNVCGNSVDVVGLLNPAFGNGCANVSDDTPEAPVLPPAPVDPPETSTPPRTVEPPTVPGGHEPMLPERSPSRRARSSSSWPRRARTRTCSPPPR